MFAILLEQCSSLTVKCYLSDLENRNILMQIVRVMHDQTVRLRFGA